MKVDAHYLFSNRDKIGSKLICWVSDRELYNSGIKLSEYPSHIALLINRKWVFESTLENNVHISSYNKWKKINNEVYRLEYPGKVSFPQFKSKIRKLEGKKYDWLGIIYFGYRLLLNILFHTPLPINNKLQDKNKYFCSELVGSLTEASYEMATPSRIFWELRKSLKSHLS